MASVKPVAVYTITNGFGKVDVKAANSRPFPRYGVPSETGLDGPEQILSSDVDATWEPDGTVRVKFDDQSDDHEPISVPGLLARAARDYPYRPALVSQPDADGNRAIITYRVYESQVRSVAKAFLHLGLERHHSVCILGFNAPQWFIADLAAIYAGGFAAGIYTTNSAEACQYCAQTSRANIIVVENNSQLKKILKIKGNLPKLKAIVQYEGIPKAKNVLSWNELLEIGRKQSDNQLNKVLKTIGVNECCTLVYTSGTTGNPKAVMLSHDNLLSDADATKMMLGLREAQEVIISFLPLSHSAAQCADVFLSIAVAATVHIADKNALKGSLLDTLLAVRPTIFFAVPRVWEKIHEKMQAALQNDGLVRSWIIGWARAQGSKTNTNRMKGIEPKSTTYRLAKWLVFGKLKASLGLDRCHSHISGAAPLSSDVKQYFMSFDIVIMDCYGMSECAGPHTITTSREFRLGSIGRTLPGFATKLDNMDDRGEGEICMNGRHVFMGYLNNPEKTNETKDQNSWLHSGDLGKMDADGFLYITGRIKELVITAGGENIPPVRIEDLVKEQCPAISNAMLVGDTRKYLTILIALKTQMDVETGAPLDAFSEKTLNWAQALGSSSTTVTEVLTTRDHVIEREISEAIDRANEKAISNAQRVQKFRILPHDFSIPTGELGPTLKLKRNEVLHKYADLIDDMYKE
ncbi:long-chain-fatty-acid--CoA ligase ACSBG2-like [Phymastichus coffea]|uniref:long-chain-fatty-acid--CoA ligase ACSBG2-like n=1 Tax=Phymastichus coffea TaxID=108790 RepID=UPI00273C9277|nr:long-chain-fatty-acid--CoA ligase ACSBG2-like [Phymastichus coffea]